MTLKRWPDKDPVEKLGLTFTFADAMATGETITTVSLSVAVKSGTDASAAAMLDGVASIIAGQVFQRVKSGVDQAVYLVRCDATLSSGRVIALGAHLPVKALS
ncbi:MAG: hypothetical protein M0R47_15860 [Methylobacter sp.]|uniref:phage fiber-tail adaptor protein n=1 Tax=Methylobacter sp. TaxID=2051955 RepID=UPI0025E6FD7E|nr:hypothetical protein [Methylobacter sp.]MCK9621996.1 hypothetical protein [Methylobacter sp.]